MLIVCSCCAFCTISQNSDLRDLIIAKTYRCTYSIAASASKLISGAELGMEAIPGYTSIAIRQIYSGNSNVAIAAASFLTGSDNAVALRNNLSSTSLENITLTITISFVKNSYWGDLIN